MMEEMRTLIAGLLVLATLTSAHPYSPYSDYKVDEQKNVDLSEEAVAAYLKSKMDKEKLDPATIVEYVESLLQGGEKNTPQIQGGGKGKPGPSQTETNCVPNGSTYSLQKAQMEMFLDTLYPSTGNSVPFSTILTPNHGTDMYVEETNHLRAYQIMLSGHTSDSVKNIWANYAPCPACVHALMNHFEKESDKPVVHVARIIDFADNVTLDYVLDTLKCLAKLKHIGFDIQAFNFEDFKKRDPAFSDSCNSLINTYYGSANFTSAVENLQTHVAFVEQLGESGLANSWCGS